MRCKELMKKDVKFVEPTETVKAAAMLMRDENIGFLPVCNSDVRALGTLTDRDIAVRVVAAGLSAEQCVVSDVMTPEVAFVRPEDDIAKAEQLMADAKKSRVIVMDDNDRVCGIISLADIAAGDDTRRAGETLRGISSREVRP